MPKEMYGERYEFLPKAELLTSEEITRLAAVLVERGVRRIRITGGEPLVRRNLDRLVGMLSAVDLLRALDDALTDKRSKRG